MSIAPCAKLTTWWCCVGGGHRSPCHSRRSPFAGVVDRLPCAAFRREPSSPAGSSPRTVVRRRWGRRLGNSILDPGMLGGRRRPSGLERTRAARERMNCSTPRLDGLYRLVVDPSAAQLRCTCSHATRNTPDYRPYRTTLQTCAVVARTRHPQLPGDVTRGGGIPGMARRQYVGRHDGR